MSGECHKCKHRADLENGKFSKMEFDATPCAKCQLVENSDYTLEYDSGRESRSLDSPSFAEATASMESRIEPSQKPGEMLLPISVMNELVAQLLSLPPEIRDVVCWRFSGMSYRDIALLQGLSMAAVEMRHWRAMQKWPALNALFAEKVAKQVRRKAAGSRKCSVGGSCTRKQTMRGRGS